MTESSDATDTDFVSPPAANDGPLPGSVWAISFAFWMSLLLAAFLYAAVALAPRLAGWMQIREVYIANAHRLKSLEDEVDDLERVRDALLADPEFAARLAESSLSPGTLTPDDVPVSGTLIFGRSETLQDLPPRRERTPGTVVVALLAGHRQLRAAMLILASLLVVYSFRTLNGPGRQLVAASLRSAVAIARLPIDRYRRIDPAENERSPVSSRTADCSHRPLSESHPAPEA